MVRRKKEDKRHRRIFIFKLTLVMIVLAFLISGIIYFSVAAYRSVKISCDIIPSLYNISNSNNHNISRTLSVEELNQKMAENNLSYTVLGLYDPVANKLSFKNDADIDTIYHELCHQDQQFKGRAYSCSNKFGVFINEFECYVREHIHD